MKNITYMNINSNSSKIRGFEDSKKMDSRIKRIVHCKLSIIHYSLLIILFLLPLGNVWGQTTVQVGSGTTGTYNIPLDTYYNYSYSQQIYMADEIRTNGWSGSGSVEISSISFQYIWTASQTKNPVTIYLGNTSKSEFVNTTDWISLSNQTQVYSGSITFPAASSTTSPIWVEINTSGFTWDGTSNIVVTVVNNNGAYTTSYNNTFYMHTISPARYATLYYHVDGSTSLNPVSTSYTASSRVNTRNNIKFKITQPCTTLATPTLTATPVVGGVSLSWGAVSNASSYTVEWGTTSACSDGSQNVTGTSTTISFTSGTRYFRVRANGNGSTYCNSEYSTVQSAAPISRTLSVSSGSVGCSGSGTVLTATATGFSSPRYTWSVSPSTGAGLPSSHTNLTSNTITVTPTVGGNYTYTCSVTEGGSGSATTASITIYVPQTPTVTISPATATSCGNYDITPTINTNCGNATYAWSRNSSALGVSTPNYTATTSGTYTITVTSSGLKQYDLIVQNGVPAIVVVAPTASATGKAVPIGTGGIGSNTSAGNIAYNAATNLQRAIVVNGGVRYDSGNRTGYIIPVQSCTATASVNVTVVNNEMPSFTNPGPICAGTAFSLPTSSNNNSSYTGSPITGSWSPAVNNTQTTTYTFTPTASPNQCASTATMQVVVNALPSPSISGTTTICNGSSTTLTASGGGSYRWDNNSTNAQRTVSPTTTTTYTVTVTNSSNCSASTSKVVTVNALPSPSISGTTTICNGTSTTLTASGGGTYRWDNNSTNAQRTVSPTTNTTYTVTVTNSSNCSASTSKVVTVNALPSPSISGTTTICNGTSTTLTASGGGSYRWDNNSTSAQRTVSPTATTTYTVTVTNSSNCSASTSKVVTVNTLPSPSISGTTTICNGTSTTLTASGGGTYRWDNNSTSAQRTVSPTTTTTYTVTVTNSNNCSASTSKVVTVNALPSPNISGTTTICNGTSTTLTASGGDTYRWDDNSTNAQRTVNPTTPSTYTVTVTNSNNCSASTSVTVSTINCCNLTATLSSSSSPSCYNVCDGTITVTVDGGTAPITYTWSDGESGTSLDERTGLCADTYTVTVSDANGCVAGGIRETTTECFRITDIMYHSCNANHLEGFNEMFTLLIGPSNLDADNMRISWANTNLSFTDFCENQDAIDGINALITGGGRVIAPAGGVLPANSEVLVVTSQNFDYESFGFTDLDHEVYILFQCNDDVTDGHFGNTPGRIRTFSVSFTSPSCSDEVSYDTETNSPGDAVHYNADGNVVYYNNGCQAPVFYNEIVLTNPEEITLSYSSISGYQNVGLGEISPVTNCTGTAAYTSTDLPDGLTLNSSTGVISGTPEHQEDGSFSVTMTCDGCEAHYTVDYHFDEEPDYQGCIIEEDFSEITTGGNTATSGTNGPSGTVLDQNYISDFPTTSLAYAAGGAVKLGKSSGTPNYGFIQTAPLNLSVPFYVEFDVKGWSSVEGDIKVTVSGLDPQIVSYTSTLSGNFETKRVNFNAATSNSTVKIETTAKRAFIDNVKVCYPNPCSVEARQVAGLCEGKIVIEAEGSGGMGNFSYAWDNGAGNDYQYAGAISGTTYSVTASDEFGCVATATVTPVQTGKPVVTPNYSPITCHEGTTDIVLTVTGGAGAPYTYHWGESTSTTNTVEDVTAGTYHVTVSDANCSAESTIQVTEPDAITFSVTTTPQVCNTPGTATISNEQGGDGTYSYVWHNSSNQVVGNTATLSANAGTYSVTVSDGNGCWASTPVTIGSSSTSVSFSAAASDPTCSYQTGSIVVNNFVGASPFSVAWDGGSVENITDSYTITGLATGNYTVIVTDVDGCGDTHTGISITVPEALTLNVSTSDAICNNRSMTLTATDGFSTYAWGHGSATEGTQGTGANANTYTVTITTGGTYSVTATAANGCSADATLAVTVNPTPEAVASIVGDDEVCIGEDAELTATPTGSGYTYRWSTGEETATISIHPTAQTTYTVTVFQGECFDEETITVGTCNCGLTARAEQIAGFCEGKIIVEASTENGTGTITYDWENGLGSEAQYIAPDPDVTYTVRVSDEAGCTAEASVTPVRTGYPAIDETLVDAIQCNGETATITLSVSGGYGEYSYEWRNSENNSVGTNSNVLSGVYAGTYTVTVSDEHSCATSTSVTITEPDELTVALTDRVDQTCSTQGSIRLTITGGSGSISYSWDGGDASTYTSAVTVSLGSGSHTVSVTDGNDCTASAPVTISNNSGMTVSLNSRQRTRCYEQDGGSFTLDFNNGTSPYEILTWNGETINETNPSHTFPNLTAGNYGITVTDANGCTDNISVEVEDADEFTANASFTTPIMCHGDSFDITVAANGGTLASGHDYTYAWSNSVNTQSQTGLTTYTTYTVTVRDDNSCEAISSVEAENPSEVRIIITADEITCHGETTTITVAGEGGTGSYTGTGSFENITASTTPYTYTINDGNGCSASDNITITEPAEITVTLDNVVAQTCDDLGSVDMTITNALGTVSYSWDGGSASTYSAATTVELTAGSHTVSVIDGNGCTATASISVGDNRSNVTFDVLATSPNCFGETGNIAISNIVGTSPYTIEWTNGTSVSVSTNSYTIPDLGTGNYTITVTDTYGCSAIQSGNIITVPDQITLSYNEILAYIGTGISVSPTHSCTSSPSFSSSDIPSWLTLSSTTGEITGTPTSNVSGSFTVTMTCGGCDVDAVVNYTILMDLTDCYSTGTVLFREDFGGNEVGDDRCASMSDLIAMGMNILTNYVSAWNITECNYNANYQWNTGINGWDCRNHGDCQNSRGVYALVKYTLAGHPGWHGNLSDHTHSDDVSRGYMMQVDAGSTSGQFYETTIDDLCSGSELYFSVWILNVNSSSSISGLNFHIENADNGTVITDYTTSTISAHSNISDAQWERYGMSFTIPAGVTRVRLSLNNPNASTSGNDFAIDDIEIRLCVPQINIPASETELCSGQTYNVNATYMNEGTFVEPLQYQWFYSETGDPLDNSVWEAVAGQTAEDLSMANVQEANEGYYRLAISAQGNILTNCRALSEPIHLTVNPTPDAAISIVGDTEVCSGEDAVLAASPSGMSYVWSTTATTETISIHPDGQTTYTVTVTQGSCSNEASIEVGNCSCELTAEATQTDGFCTGDIVIEAEGVNGSGDYSYAWDGGQASAQIVGADNNSTYTVVVTDNSTHCTAEASITTSRTGYPTIAEPTVSTILCNGGTATITLSVSNGYGVHSYEWQNSENATVGTNSNELSNITAGTYTVTVTDEHLCATSTSVTVNQPNLVVVSADKTDKVCATLGTAFVTSVTGGSETGYQYQWTNDANGETIGNGESVTGLAGGNYTVLVTDSNGCPGTARVTIDDIGGTVSFSLAAHDLSCNGNGSGSIDVENIIGRSPYSIVWTSTVANGNEDDVMSSSYEISGLPAGNYTVIVTDADECSSTLTTTVDEPALLEATAELTAPILCHGDKFGVMVTANGGTLADGHAYSYSWHNGANTQSQNGLEEYGLYSVTVTDDNGCIAMASVNAIEPSEVQISISADEILCHGQTSTVTVTGNGGTGAYSGTGTFENVNAGTHTYTIADENGCHASDDITIIEPDELGVNFNNIVEQTCETLGSVDLSIFGGQGSISYSWDGGSANSYTSATTVRLTSGLHNVSVTDGNGCGYSQSVNIPNGSAMTVDVISNNRVYCNGMATGSFEIEFVNGTAPYAITWTNGTLTETASTHEFSSLRAGIYGVSVVDANGCSDNVSVEIEESDQLTVSASVTSVINCHDDAFDISASADGGNGGYSYLWNGNIAGQSRTALTEYTTYTVTVTDAEGCVAQASVSPENPQELYISSIVGNDIQCHNGTTVVNAYAGGGTGTLTYTWRTDGLPAVNSQQITAPAGTYGLTVTDSNGCMITTTYVIQNPDEISIQLTGTTDQYCTTLGEARLNVTGGTGNLSYSWDGNTNYTVTGNSVVSHLEAGEYTMTVTDANGCVATQTVTIEVGAEMSVVAGQPVPVLCFGDRNGSFTINMQDGMAPYTIVWNSGTFTEMSNSHEFDNLAAGSYNVTITDAHNCVSTISVEIETPELLVASSSAEQILCHGETAEVTVSATGGTLPYQNVGIYDVTAGAYNYVVTDANGCQSTTFVSLVEPTDISVNAVSANARCYGESGSANLVVTGGTSPYSVVWQDNSNGLENINVPVNSDFGYTVTDANGCTKTGVVRVGEPSVLSIELTASSVSCYGLANGSVSISAIGGGVPPYSYQWSNGYSSNNLVGVGAGSYSLLVTDTNGCTASSTVVVTEPALLNVGIIANNVECGVSQGSLMANTYGGNTPYSYMWSNGGISETLSGVSSGSYSLTVTDANGCMATATSQISVVGMLSASIEEVNPISCFGASDATLTVTSVYAQQPVIYQWSNGQSGPAIYGVDAGLYVVTLTDAWGCEGVASYQVNSPTELIMYSQISDAKCHNTNDGSITLNVSGGHEPYQYLWSNGSSEPNLFGIRRGVYSVVVTDSNGCVSQGNFTVNSPAPVVINADVTDVDCYGSKNGRVEIHAEGGVEPYDYGFVNGSSVTHGRTVYDHLRPGVYRIDVKDANGCTESTSVAVAQPERLGVVAMEHAPSCKDLNDGYVELVVAGGSAPYTYTLDDYTSDSSIFTGLRSGVYNIVVTDASGCTKTVDDVVISESYNDCIRIPNVFTPNGDGVNDEWIIENIELFPDAHIYVFNRWGQLLYHERGNGKRWDGSYRGHFVPSGVYLYIIKLHSDEDTYKGTVTVLF